MKLISLIFIQNINPLHRGTETKPFYFDQPKSQFNVKKTTHEAKYHLF